MRLVERIVETDDELTLKYLEGEEISSDELRVALRKATLRSELTPVFCGSALRNKGVQPLLDAVVDFLPSPLDVEAIEGVNPYTEKVESRDADDEKPATALVFKIATDPYVGRLAYLRLYSGHVTASQTLLNPTKNRRNREVCMAHLPFIDVRRRHLTSGFEVTVRRGRSSPGEPCDPDAQCPQLSGNVFTL